ncbi:MAG: T9SS type A sorting domain-containing protein [Flavobacteriales bacterium]|nr:T9SS type A sorting domain-containing protein [Flavobacteriales bacterium]
MHNIYTLIFSLFFLANVSAQICVPDTQYTSTGNWPDTIPLAYVDLVYNTVITNVVPLDTVIDVAGIPTDVTVNYVEITDFTGLPAGFTYQCNPSDCIFIGGSIGCILVEGPAPAISDIGIYPVEIYTNTEGVAIVLGFPITQNQLDTVKTYYIEIADTSGSQATSVKTKQLNPSTELELLNVYPSPSFDNATVSFYSNNNESIELSIMDITGKIIYSKSVNAGIGIHQEYVNVSDFDTGIYFVSATKGAKQQTTKFTVIH